MKPPEVEQDLGVVKTGSRASVLLQAMLTHGYKTAKAPKVPRWPGQDGRESARTIDVYRKLGGVQIQPRLAPGKWDLSFQDLVVELDEELHFNRYRLVTLSQDWSEVLPWATDYRAFSLEHEGNCVRAGSWGKRWATTSTEVQFGPPGGPEDLTGAGAPRWKQRALYDSMKDGLAAAGVVRLARLSVHDIVGGVTLDEVLRQRAECDLMSLEELLHRRTSDGEER